ncbi:uncharacterized protein LOC129804174 isoform X2 [Phlebotomus papatasi]|nr:uncharacterized protein LOC129804174 isoform X2 [Phlebotomus papatasi]XP_055707227.1 uncharacterized protein LOC129804174 isoform X2 [Phlebotomus papatasi]XP_055707229.1 uncharacterized protein LOC129804174 isoform X2 [Phlebotomus papatasi]
MFLQKMKRFVKIVSILLVLVLSQCFAAVNSKTAQEISPNGIHDLWNKCNSAVELETLVGNVGRFMKALLFKNNEHCEDRLQDNFFLIIDKTAVKFADFPKECLMYIHETSDPMLNVQKRYVIPSRNQNQYVVVELVLEDLQYVIEILDLKPVLEPVFNPATHHDVFTADLSGQLKIKHNTTTYIDFDAHTIFHTLGLRSIDEIRKSLYYPTLEPIILPNKYKPGGTYNISWNTVMIPYEAEVRLRLRTCYTNGNTANVFAMIVQEKILNETIRVESILTNLSGASNDIAVSSLLLALVALISAVSKFLD